MRHSSIVTHPFSLRRYNEEAVSALTFQQARQVVFAKLHEARIRPDVEMVEISEAAGRVLAESIRADRDLPPVTRSVRDGFAVRAGDLPGTLRIVGEVRAGVEFSGELGPGDTIEIMTGAPLPAGANAVVMVEHVRRAEDKISTDYQLNPGDNVSAQGSEASCGEAVLEPGVRLSYAAVAVLAIVGRSSVSVYRKPRVAILSTGDEIVPLHERPMSFQVRNSNAYSLAVQVRRAGGEPDILSVARDEWESTRSLVARGLECDFFLLSGGVSAGKYDIVERVLASFGAEFFFDRVLIQPGQPLVFGSAHNKFFFGLPGNPGSTMVTFELFARAAVETLGGQIEPMMPLLWTRISQDFTHKTGLTRFLPARLAADGSCVTPVHWKGSSDVAALARANAFLVAEADRESWSGGDWIRVLPQ